VTTENHMLRAEMLALTSKTKDDCPCDLSLFEELIRENAIDINHLKIISALLDDYTKVGVLRDSHYLFSTPYRKFE
jgi:hypothetical protein